MKNYKFWFITGSQLLYGEECLRQVRENSQIIVKALNDGGNLPWKVEYKETVVTNASAREIVKKANADDGCAGIITYCHTFSPSKMWINAFDMLQKPYLHFHTQFNEAIPDQEIDMDYMNLHQAAHGDREHGFIGARMHLKRKVIAGYWKDDSVQRRIGKWMRAAIGAAVSKNMQVIRFGDNMREVAVTEGDKVETQRKLGWQVNTWPVGQLVEYMRDVTDAEIDLKMAEYEKKYVFKTDDMETIKYQAREEIAMKKMMDEEGCAAFSNTFQDLYGMEQLPGLATQNLMSDGYGYGGEGDWKTAAMVAIMKAMGHGLSGGSSFMEDYTYDLSMGVSLGAHMLEVCPSIAENRASVEVYPLGIGGRKPPARLVFEGRAADAIVASLVDMGGRLRLIVQDVECIKPTQAMPNLPVARVMWKPLPSLTTGAECWILAGGAHHTVLSYDCDAEMMRDWARIMDIEFVHINKETDSIRFEQELTWSDIAWKLK